MTTVLKNRHNHILAICFLGVLAVMVIPLPPVLLDDSMGWYKTIERPDQRLHRQSPGGRDPH